MNEIWDFSDYPLKDLFRVRDCWVALRAYSLENEEGLKEVEAEIERRADEGGKNV